MKRILIIHILFWALIPLGTIWTANKAIETHSIYMALLVLIDCICMANMIINYEDYRKLKNTPNQ